MVEGYFSGLLMRKYAKRISFVPKKEARRRADLHQLILHPFILGFFRRGQQG